MLWCRELKVCQTVGADTGVLCRYRLIAVIGMPVITRRLHNSKNGWRTTQRATAMLCGHANVQGARKHPKTLCTTVHAT